MPYRILHILLLMLGILASLPAQAQTASAAAEDTHLRQVIESQLAAFEKDDAPLAFSFAAPEIQRRYGHNASTFLQAVRLTYPVVYRPKTVAFLKSSIRGDRAAVPVLMTDAKDQSWLATYTLRRQPDKTWRILGCDLSPSNSRFT